MNKDTYCSFCGEKFSNDSFPQECIFCLNITYKNPIPVTVTVIEVYDNAPVFGYKKLGYLIQKRNIEPKKEKWALTSGYIELGESWKQATARELFEEVGISIDPEEELCLLDVLQATNGNILIVNLLSVNKNNIKFIPNREVTEIKIINEEMELAFPTHTQILKDVLNKRY